MRFAVLDPPNNHNILAKELTHSFRFRESSRLSSVILEQGRTLFEKQTRIGYVYFPTNCVVSRIYLANCGHTSEMGMVGREGIVGISLFLGDDEANNDAIVHVGGPALRMDARAALKEFQQTQRFQSALLRYTRAAMSQISQVSACNSLHSVEQRLCRWLLMTFDRTPLEEIRVSHQFIAQMLAVRRESVSTALANLQAEGLIKNGTRRVRLLDRSGMETAACECYLVITEAYTRLIPGWAASKSLHC
mgnify:CR=1 FL=1